jgi:hypothetical protein
MNTRVLGLVEVAVVGMRDLQVLDGVLLLSAPKRVKHHLLQARKRVRLVGLDK